MRCGWPDDRNIGEVLFFAASPQQQVLYKSGPAGVSRGKPFVAHVMTLTSQLQGPLLREAAAGMGFPPLQR